MGPKTDRGPSSVWAPVDLATARVRPRHGRSDDTGRPMAPPGRTRPRGA